jgi:hypothetical protein
MADKGILTDAMVRCLIEMKRHGAAERVWTDPKRQEAWVWKIGGLNEPRQQINKGLMHGLFVAHGERVTMTDRGRVFAARASQLAARAPTRMAA